MLLVAMGDTGHSASHLLLGGAAKLDRLAAVVATRAALCRRRSSASWTTMSGFSARWRKALAPPAAVNSSTSQTFATTPRGITVRKAPAARIYEGLSTLAQFPHRGAQEAGTRELVFPGLPFLAVYRVTESAIEIAHILHGAQKWP